MEPPGSIRIIFGRHSSVPLSPEETVALWDDISGGTISERDGSILLTGYHRLSYWQASLRWFLALMPVFQRPRELLVVPADIEEVLIGTTGLSSRTTFHLAHRVDPDSIDVHVLLASEKKDNKRIEELLASVIPGDRMFDLD